MISEIFDCPRVKSSFLKHHIKEATLQYMMCGLLKQWNTIRRCSSFWKETALLLMKLRETLMRVTVLQISFAVMKTKTCRTNPDRLRCADFCFYTWLNLWAYDTHTVGWSSVSVFAREKSNLPHYRSLEAEQISRSRRWKFPLDAIRDSKNDSDGVPKN